MVDNNRPPAVLRNMQTLYNTGRLAGTGYLSILPVDQGVEHSAGASLPPTRSTLIRKYRRTGY
jgi:class I fructose-bisphosphate aldolase